MQSFVEDDGAEEAPQYPEDANMEDDWQLTSADVGEEAFDTMSYDAGSMGGPTFAQQQQQPLATAGGGGYPAAAGSRGFQPSMLVRGPRAVHHATQNPFPLALLSMQCPQHPHRDWEMFSAAAIKVDMSCAGR